MTFRRLTATLCLGGSLVATAAARQLHPHDPAWSAPATAGRRLNPLAGRVGVVGGGRKIFHQRCAECHGDDARGTDRAPDLAQPAVQGQSDGALFWKISSGNTREGMPTFSFLPEAQRWQVVLYLRTLP